MHTSPTPSSPSQNFPKALTVSQFYEAIDKIIGINTLYEYVRSGRIKSFSIGRKYLIPRSEVDNFFLREIELN